MARVELGPVSSGSVLSWIEAVEKTLDELTRSSGKLPFAYPIEIDSTFRAFIAEWRQRAEDGPEFRWSGAIEPDFLRILLTYWFDLASLIASEPRTIAVERHTPEADEFYAVLIPCLLAVLESDEEHADFARNLRERWPWPNR